MHEYYIVGANGILMNLYGVFTIFFGVSLLDGLCGKFAGLAQGYESGAKCRCHNCAKDESACLDAHHLGDAFVLIQFYYGIAHNIERFWIFECGCEILELDSFYWKVRNVSHFTLYVVNLFFFHVDVYY